ncbi:hypothetical protein Micbo1qcDRAFT_209513 [Microdochium bolleyi]|uniref:Uncharacterized protein n=1 Tax=Microdochium bolleyi TaxID=196109 RepID=A0A136ILW0_9PEZI|nr:hypothetical protein Micbo1qcDRAFT_209513 [Microdochium bolleyi]
MVRLYHLPIAAVAVSAVLVPRSGDDPERYTICGGDRGYVEKDSLEAAEYLREKIVTSDRFFMAKDDCIYAARNTTIVSLCNGSARDRHVNRAEVGRGINQLIKDCGLDGGFTGIHVVNNLTFAAYGTSGGLKRSPPTGSPPPDVPGGSSRRSKNLLAKRDCNLDYNGKWAEDCDRENEMNDDGTCGETSADSDCKVYCELKRRKLLGQETSAPGEGGEPQSSGTDISLEDSQEFSVSSGFSIGVEGSFKDAISAGVSYQFSVTKTTGYTVVKSNNDDPPEGDGIFGRWVFFPKLIETCGTVTQREVKKDVPACPGVGVCPPPGDPYCSGDPENHEDVCSISPELDDKGEPAVFWALRWERGDGTALDFEDQSQAYRDLCSDASDPDNDGEDECYTDLEDRRRRAPINFKWLEARKAAVAAGEI